MKRQGVPPRATTLRMAAKATSSRAGHAAGDRRRGAARAIEGTHMAAFASSGRGLKRRRKAHAGELWREGRVVTAEVAWCRNFAFLLVVGVLKRIVPIGTRRRGLHLRPFTVAGQRLRGGTGGGGGGQ